MSAMIEPAWLIQAPLGGAIIDPHGIVLGANSLALEFLETKHGRILLPTHDWPVFREHLAQAKSFHYLVGEQGFVFTPVTLSPEQTLIWIVPSVGMDADLVQMQRDLVQQRKMANLGRMMAEMAHELNNPLAGISMGCQLIGMALQTLQTQLGDQNPVVPDLVAKMTRGLERVQEAAQRASNLRHELLAYGKSDSVSLERHNLSALLDKLVHDIAQQPPLDTLKIDFVPATAPASVMCNPSKLGQILFNLLKNAYDATEGSGTVRIRENIKRDQVCIEVEDDGPGIPPELLDKIFSPFLTTKPRTGTGLGLSISQQIIHQHGGSFSVYNKPASGACFRITLPIAEGTISTSTTLLI